MSLHMTIGSKAEKLLSPGTLMMKNKDKSLSVEDKVEGLDSEKKQVDFGSKEETFFDSQGWLDSDSEDDFVSVNGDTTTSQISSADPKRKLAELLQENQVEVAEFLMRLPLSLMMGVQVKIRNSRKRRR
ncbi:uncharacterized protein LOC103988635 isoform X4 [Musa acuminata AAA Group]|uniref:uncharacterized protein LOC103988635 isoform X4 n=1 Tax=Musa acuminata AAA Group TaxID=214697 RepID=UPI0031D1EA10